VASGFSRAAVVQARELKLTGDEHFTPDRTLLEARP
jgi:hypothetical protein